MNMEGCLLRVFIEWVNRCCFAVVTCTALYRSLHYLSEIKKKEKLKSSRLLINNAAQKCGGSVRVQRLDEKPFYIVKSIFFFFWVKLFTGETKLN